MNCGTPLVIEVLIHCHVTPEPHPRAGAPAVARAIRYLESNGLIRNALSDSQEELYQTTDKGKAHIRQLCNLPFPRQAWVDPDGKLIGENNS